MRHFLFSLFTAFLTIVGLSVTTASCSSLFPASDTPQSEAQALENLRNLTRNGQLPPESAIAAVEARFPNTKTAALARLLRAFVLLQTGDALNASGLLDNDFIARRTSLGDYALLLRGQALLKAGKLPEAAAIFEKITTNFPNSLRVREAKLGIAQARAGEAGEVESVQRVLQDLLEQNDAAAWLIAAQANERANRLREAIAAYRRIYFYAPAAPEAVEAEIALKRLTVDVNAATKDELIARAEALSAAKKWSEAANFYNQAAAASDNQLTAAQQLNRGIALSNAKRYADAATVLNAVPISAGNLRMQALAKSAENYANARQWANARKAIESLRREFPANTATPAALVNLGMIARDQKNAAEEAFYLQTAINAYPNAVDVGKAQFEIAWLNHDNGNFTVSAAQLTEHLARYAAQDTTYRGRAGYWAARDNERIGRLPEACALYEAMLARYDANWYGYLSNLRLSALRANRQCPANNNFSPDSIIGKAAANLKTVTIAPETAGRREAEKIAKADELGAIALYDWSLQELAAAAQTAPNSPKINLALARLNRRRDDFVGAFLALARSYPDYSQMKPEELSIEEWDIFYPLNFWSDIKKWAAARNLDSYQVAGLIRQESVFYPRAKSGANAFGLMQLLIPTARAVARKTGSTAIINSAEDLYNPALNMELGTAYMREQFDKYGRIEYVAAAYNAGPGRVTQWRSTLPAEIDEWVEAIPFRETKAYVQGVIRNTAQYRRLYDENGKFRPNVGTKPVRGALDSNAPEQFAKENPEIKFDESDTKAE
jgi:soluble lytic murein transglycosylase